MKLNFYAKILSILTVFVLMSCSSESVDVGNLTTNVNENLVVNYSYTTLELETLKAINVYRESIGLKHLDIINHISFKSEEHDIYMIENKVFNHDDFVSRSENIKKVLGAKTVAENIALNFVTPKAVLDAWLKSPKHKIVIEGDFTHFGISVRQDPSTGENYFTNIFAKI